MPDKPDLSTEYQPKGAAANPSDTLDKPAKDQTVDPLEAEARDKADEK